MQIYTASFLLGAQPKLLTLTGIHLKRKKKVVVNQHNQYFGGVFFCLVVFGFLVFFFEGGEGVALISKKIKMPTCYFASLKCNLTCEFSAHTSNNWLLILSLTLKSNDQTSDLLNTNESSTGSPTCAKWIFTIIHPFTHCVISLIN